jgi:methyl-accepting chemotaxis protein
MFKTMKTWRPLGMGFGLVSLLLVLISAICLWRLGEIGSGLDRVVNDGFPKSVIAGDIIAYVNSNARVTREMVLADSKEEIDGRLRKIAENRKGITESFDKLVKASRSESVNLASGSEELSSSSEQISRSMGEQARRASQIASATTEMAQTVADMAGNASGIVKSVEQTVTVAKDSPRHL